VCHQKYYWCSLRHNPNNLHTKLTRPNRCRNNNSRCCHAHTNYNNRHTHTHTPKVKKQKRKKRKRWLNPKTKISLVMKDIKSKNQQLRHEIEATFWKQAPKQLLVGQKRWATMDSSHSSTISHTFSTSLSFSLSLSLSTFPSILLSVSVCVYL